MKVGTIASSCSVLYSSSSFTTLAHERFCPAEDEAGLPSAVVPSALPTAFPTAISEQRAGRGGAAGGRGVAATVGAVAATVGATVPRGATRGLNIYRGEEHTSLGEEHTSLGEPTRIQV